LSIAAPRAGRGTAMGCGASSATTTIASARPAMPRPGRRVDARARASTAEAPRHGRGLRPPDLASGSRGTRRRRRGGYADAR
jgi:hypothetical protein